LPCGSSALMRFAVTERLVETGGKYTLPAPETEQG
jgi:hypothetical protein